MQTAPEAPLACTLPSAALPERLARIRQVTNQSLLSYHLDGKNLQLRYRREAAAELEQIVDAERGCCSFLQFDLKTARDAVELNIHAPAGVDADAQWLFAQFLPTATATSRKGCGCAPGACGQS